MPPVEVKQRATRSTKLYVEHKFQKYQNGTFMNSFFPHFTKLYNKIEPETRNLSTADFKEKLKPVYKHKKVKHFSRGLSKWSNSLHTQLRWGWVIKRVKSFGLNNEFLNSKNNTQVSRIRLFILKVYAHQNYFQLSFMSQLLKILYIL